MELDSAKLYCENQDASAIHLLEYFNLENVPLNG